MSQQKCLCFDIDIKHEDNLPIPLCCDSCQVTIQHQCPIAETFRAEVPITEIETRRDHWNKVIAQQMVPKEGRVSHISFEHDKKQAARRYYDLRTTTIESMSDYTNIITISSQPPAWFFSPKELTRPLKECLQEVNYCDNSFIQETFVTNSDIVELKLRHQDFLKYRDHHKWLFYHIVLGPEQCFQFKSVHLERDQWKVRYYDELVIRTFEQASLFVTLPPGVSISQVIDNHESCHFQEAYTSIDSSQRSPNISTTPTGLKGQYINATPTKNFVNGSGMPQNSRTKTRGQPCQSSHRTGLVYCPPPRSRQSRSATRKSPESDVEMLPAQVSEAQNFSHAAEPRHPNTQEQGGDVPMECRPTALDPEEHGTPETEQDLRDFRSNDITIESPIPNNTPDHTNFPETESNPQKEADLKSSPGNAEVANAKDSRSTTGHRPVDQVDTANVDNPGPVGEHNSVVTCDTTNTANVGYPRLDSATQQASVTDQPSSVPKKNNNIPHPTNAVNHNAAEDLPSKDCHSRNPGRANQLDQRRHRPSRTNSTSKAAVNPASKTIRVFLTQNTAYQPITHDLIELITDDDVYVVQDHTKSNPLSIESILCRSEHSRDLLQSSKEIIAGWPNSFAHADSDHFAKLATCYLIQFPSFMCYAVTALRVLTHAPWTDSMFHGHIRELILCVIGNGWAWADQTAMVQGRRISTGEVCAALASYTNQTAFPPGQVSDLDTAIIAVCDDLYPDHCEFFSHSLASIAIAVEPLVRFLSPCLTQC